MSIDRKHASINNTVDGDRYISYIHPLWYINNGNRLYNTLRTSLHIVDNNICNLLVRYDWTQCETVCIVNWHTTLTPLYSSASLSNSKMAYNTCGVTGNIRTEDDINNDAYENGEHHVSLHNTGSDSTHCSVTTKRNISSVQNNGMYKSWRVRVHDDNTHAGCNTVRLIVEFDNVSMHNISPTRWDGRGVSADRFKVQSEYASNLDELERYL